MMEEPGWEALVARVRSWRPLEPQGVPGAPAGHRRSLSNTLRQELVTASLTFLGTSAILKGPAFRRCQILPKPHLFSLPTPVLAPLTPIQRHG